jgi:hypothetical protein
MLFWCSTCLMKQMQTFSFLRYASVLTRVDRCMLQDWRPLDLKPLRYMLRYDRPYGLQLNVFDLAIRMGHKVITLLTLLPPCSYYLSPYLSQDMFDYLLCFFERNEKKLIPPPCIRCGHLQDRQFLADLYEQEQLLADHIERYYPDDNVQRRKEDPKQFEVVGPDAPCIGLNFHKLYPGYFCFTFHA